MCLYYDLNSFDIYGRYKFVYIMIKGVFKGVLRFKVYERNVWKIIFKKL